MKYLILILLANSYLAAYGQDSTQKERFVTSLLNEYDKGGRWIFVKIDSCSVKQWNEVVLVDSIYRGLACSYTIPLSKEMFVWSASINIFQDNIFSNCPSSEPIYGYKSHHINGIKIDMTLYSKLIKKSIKNILAEYFDNEKMLKGKYKRLLYELIAVCFSNNVKVITGNDGIAYYQLFK